MTCILKTMLNSKVICVAVDNAFIYKIAPGYMQIISIQHWLR